jgi:ComF family protein
MLKLLLDLLFPIESVSGDEDAWITREEREHIERTLTPLLLTRSLLRLRDVQYVDALIAATKYDNDVLLKKAIHTFKYKRIPALRHELAAWMTRAMPGLLLPPEPWLTKPVLCPVPLHWTRRFSRGFNQAALLADLVSEHTGYRTAHLLRRTRPTGHQARRKRDERLAALTDAFHCVAASPPPWVVLIDDICTTGATLDECAKALKQAGAEHVTGLVIAYG